MSCVDLPADQHLAGDAIFAKNCAHCHTVKANGSADNSKFKLFLAPGSDQVKAVAQFAQTAALAHVSLVAFGTHGVNTNGTAFSNMPAFYETLSRPDIERVVTYVHTLTPVPKVYDVFGETQP